VTVDVFERYAALDPAKSPGIQPEWSAMAPVPLSTLDGREPDMQTQQQTPKQPRPPRKRRTGLLVAATAVALVLIVGAVALLNNGSDSNLAPAAAPNTSDALAVSNAYFVAFNAGDVDALMALFVPSATFTDNLAGSLTRDRTEMLYASKVAQGTTLTTAGCSETIDDEGADKVSCTAVESDALVLAVSAPPVPVTIVMDVTPGGIAKIFRVVGSPDYKDVGRPFEQWMPTNNSADAAKTDFGTWTTTEEARESGELAARYADEWAAYLEDNNCTYQDGC